MMTWDMKFNYVLKSAVVLSWGVHLESGLEEGVIRRAFLVLWGVLIRVSDLVIMPSCAKILSNRTRRRLVLAPSHGMKVSLEWHESLRQGRAYSCHPLFGRRQGYRIMPCPSGDFFVTSRRPNQYPKWMMINGEEEKTLKGPNIAETNLELSSAV